MKRFILLVLILAIAACIGIFLSQLKNQEKTKLPNLCVNIPTNAVYLIETPNLASFVDAIQDNELLFPYLNEAGGSLNLSWAQKLVQDFTEEEAISATLSLHLIGKDNYEKLWQIHLPERLLKNWKVLVDTSLQISSSSDYEGYAINTWKFSGHDCFAVLMGKNLFLSEHAEVLKACIRRRESDASADLLSNPWLDLRNTRGKNEVGHFYANPEKWNKLLKEKNLPKTWLGEVFQTLSCLDIKFGINEIRLAGIAMPKGLNPAILSIKAESRIPSAWDAVPADAEKIYWWNIDNWTHYLVNTQRLAENLGRGNEIDQDIKTISNESRAVVEQKLQDLFEEDAYEFELSKQVVKTIGISSEEKLLRYFPAQVIKTGEKISGYSLIRLQPQLGNLLWLTEKKRENTLALVLNQNLYLAENKQILADVARNIISGNTLKDGPWLKEMGEQINLNSSFIAIQKQVAQVSEKSWIEGLNKTQEYGISVFSYLKDQRFYLEYFSSFEEQTERAGPEIWEIDHGHTALFKPEMVLNHYTGDLEWVAIDNQGGISLHSKSGRSLWRKKLPQNPMRPPLQIDLYKNGKLQLAFNTKNTLELIDRNGNDVSPFPVKIDKQISSPVLVADYDLNKDYRFLFAAGKKLYNYDKEGQATQGWDVFEAQHTITEKPIYLKIGNKDYILAIDESGKVYVLNRRGKIRYETNIQIEITGNYYLEKGSDISNSYFLYLNAKDQLVSHYLNGKIDRQNLPSIEQISQFSKVSFGQKTMWLALSMQSLYILDDRLNVVRLIPDVAFPFLETGSNQYPLVVNKMNPQEAVILDHDHNLIPFLNKNLESATITRFTDQGKYYVLCSEMGKTLCYELPSQK
ncbi:MAG: hypothetical protein ACPF8V_04230 [Luteibaculum sp.]